MKKKTKAKAKKKPGRKPPPSGARSPHSFRTTDKEYETFQSRVAKTSLTQGEFMARAAKIAGPQLAKLFPPRS